MKKVLFATENRSKTKRFKDGLLKNNIEIITINDLEKKLDIEENGKNAIENALIKAREYAKVYNLPVFAMDDNLYIENIPDDKQPGIYVRRVNGKRLNDDEMIKYYSNLASIYVDTPSNRIDSGYPLNSISINKKLNKYFTDITEDDKKEIQEDESDVIDFLCKHL